MTLGLAIPSFTPHAISVSLPTWSDNIAYEEGDKRVVDALITGYPRFFIHRSVQKLVRIAEQKFGAAGESCMIFPTKRIAASCRAFVLDRSIASGMDTPRVRLVQFLLCPQNENDKCIPSGGGNTIPLRPAGLELHIVFFPAEIFSIAKQFWQHTGTGISSRLAERCLSMLPDQISPPHSPAASTPRYPSKNKHYAVPRLRPSIDHSDFGSLPDPPDAHSDSLGNDQRTYVEERYGRNLPLSSAVSAKRAMRRRIARVLLHDDAADNSDGPVSGDTDAPIGPSLRGVPNVTEDDVYLFPCGMSAIWHTHQIIMAVRPSAKSVCFGFPYTDTIKILDKWGPGCHFLGHGLDSSIDELETLLAETYASDPHTSPILSLFTEFPSNPLLRSADLPRLRALADKYDFLIVIDETIGNFVNVQVMPYADIVVSSLSKIFSGSSNVMGGSLVLNPKGRHYAKIKANLDSSYEDVYFGEDAIYMERNSRDFERRTQVIDSNTEAVCEFLHTHSVAGGDPSAVIKKVFYPKWETREHYERCRVRDNVRGVCGGGFGGLFSLTFTCDSASQAFFDALPCHKGPSLGTNFTLACPYTILAHYTELEWAARYGVDKSLVRVSIGTECKEELLRVFELALQAGKRALLQRTEKTF